jgi:hypothetical protein
MQQNYRSLAMAPAVSHPPAFGVLWAKAANHDAFLLYLSLLILLFSTVDTGPLGNLAKLCWLISFLFLAFSNIGAAFVAYIASLAIYSPLHFQSMTSLLQRPDNLAVLILFPGSGNCAQSTLTWQHSSSFFWLTDLSSRRKLFLLSRATA